MEVLQKIESERSTTILRDGLKVLDRIAKVCVPLFEMGYDMNEVFGTELTGLMTHFHTIRTATDQLRTELRQIQNAGFKARIRAIENKIDKSEAELKTITSSLSAYLAQDNEYTEHLDEVTIPNTFYQDEQNNGGFTPLIQLNSVLHSLLQLHQHHTMTTPEAEAARADQQRELERKEKLATGQLEQYRSQLTNDKQTLAKAQNTYENNITGLKESINNIENYRTQTETQFGDGLTNTIETDAKRHTSTIEDLTIQLNSVDKELSHLRVTNNDTLATLNRSLFRNETALNNLLAEYDDTCFHNDDVRTVMVHRIRTIQDCIKVVNEKIEEYDKWRAGIKKIEDRNDLILAHKLDHFNDLDNAGAIIEAGFRGFKARSGDYDKWKKEARRLRLRSRKGSSSGSRGTSRGRRSMSTPRTPIK